MKHCCPNTTGLFLLFVLASQVSAQIARLPYLQVITPNSIVIRWDTQTAEVGTVFYGASVTSLTGSKSESGATTKHEIAIAGLSPKQKYYYSVTGSSGGAADQYFVTAPGADSAQFTRIWVISDFGQSASSGDNARRALTVDVWKTFNNNDYHADFMLSLGDQSENDLDAELQNNYFNQLKDVLKTTPLYTIAGNHEDTDGEMTYKAAFTVPASGEAGGIASGTEDYYAFTFGNIHVVGLTVENSVSISGAQEAWLQNDLANNHSDWLIAFMHRPMHSGGYHPTDGNLTALDQKAHWLPLLEAAGVDLILAGHNHCYERSYLLDNLTGNSTDATPANKIDTGLGRIDGNGAYQKEPGTPHQGTVFITCEGGGTSNKPSYMPVPYGIFPVFYRADNNEGSLVIDVDGNRRMDVKFLCDETGLIGSHIWDSFTVVKNNEVTSAHEYLNRIPGSYSVTNYPNPFNPSTSISYGVPKQGTVSIIVYDMLGRMVATLVDGEKERGSHTIAWAGKDDRGNEVVSGMYVVQLRADGFMKSAKMMLLR